MKKIILICLICLVVLLLAGALFFFFFLSPGGYKPGDINALEERETFLTPPQDQQKEHFFAVSPEIDLFYTAGGKGEPVLILHGGPGYPSSSHWKGLEALEEQYRFIYYHQRGSGKSSRPLDTFKTKNYMENKKTAVETLGIKQQIADVERIRRILGQEQITIMGHSFGGFIAALYAAEFPGQVKKLVLISPANMLLFPQEKGTDLFALIEENLTSGSERAEFKLFMKEYFNYGKIFEKSEAELTVLNNRLGGFYAKAMENMGQKAENITIKEGYDNGWMTHAVFFSLGRKYDHRDALAALTCPVLLIHGTGDFLMSMEAMNTYKNSIPGARMAVIDNAGHFSFEDKPQDFARIIADFLAGKPVGQ